MNVINLTPHEIVLFHKGKEIKFSASGTVARVVETEVGQGWVQGLPMVCYEKSGSLQNLPKLDVEAVYIVSLACLAHAPEGYTFVAPDTGPEGAVRDDQGRIKGVRRFKVYA